MMDVSVKLLDLGMVPFGTTLASCCSITIYTCQEQMIYMRQNSYSVAFCILMGTETQKRIEMQVFKSISTVKVECPYCNFLHSSADGDRLLCSLGYLPGLLVDLHALLRRPVLVHRDPEHLHRSRCDAWRHFPGLRVAALLDASICGLFLCFRMCLQVANTGVDFYVDKQNILAT